MWLCENPPFVFIHVPKTAGKSVIRSLAGSGGVASLERRSRIDT